MSSINFRDNFQFSAAYSIFVLLGWNQMKIIIGWETCRKQFGQKNKVCLLCWYREGITLAAGVGCKWKSLGE